MPLVWGGGHTLVDLSFDGFGKIYYQAEFPCLVDVQVSVKCIGPGLNISVYYSPPYAGHMHQARAPRVNLGHAIKISSLITGN